MCLNRFAVFYAEDRLLEAEGLSRPCDNLCSSCKRGFTDPIYASYAKGLLPDDLCSWIISLCWLQEAPWDFGSLSRRLQESPREALEDLEGSEVNKLQYVSSTVTTTSKRTTLQDAFTDCHEMSLFASKCLSVVLTLSQACSAYFFERPRVFVCFHPRDTALPRRTSYAQSGFSIISKSECLGAYKSAFAE